MTFDRFAPATRGLGLAAALSLVAGCTVFPNPEPPRVMDLAWPAQERTVPEASPHVLRVDTPYASEPFNSTRILAKPTAWEYQSYPEVRWRDSAPMVLRDAIVGSLRRSGAFAGVIAETSPAEARLNLVSELSAFHAEKPAGFPEVVVSLHAQVIDTRSRESLCRRTFDLSQTADGPAIEQVVQAFGAAGKRLTGEMIDWIRTCDYPPAPGTDPARQP